MVPLVAGNPLGLVWLHAPAGPKPGGHGPRCVPTGPDEGDIRSPRATRNPWAQLLVFTTISRDEATPVDHRGR